MHKSFFIQRAEALVAGTLTAGHRTASPVVVWSTLLFGACGALAFGPGWPETETGEGRSTESRTEASPALETIGRPVEALLRDGLFPEDAWVRLEENSAGRAPVDPGLEPRWLEALGSEEELRGLLREWPELKPGSVEDAALKMGESLETFRELRLYGEGG